jgi:RHS repeat-associated protein
MSFVHGPGVDEPLSVTYYEETDSYWSEVRKTTNYYTADALGSIVRLTDRRGNVVESYEYDTFGNFRDSESYEHDYHSDWGWDYGHDSYHSDSDMQQPYAYTGREYDAETGLYYYRARYYDSGTGRFVNRDPVVGIMVSPQTLNRYVYVTNNPVRYVDPSGLSKADGDRSGGVYDFGIGIPALLVISLNVGVRIDLQTGWQFYSSDSVGFSAGISLKYDPEGELDDRPRGETYVERNWAFVPIAGWYGSTTADED